MAKIAKKGGYMGDLTIVNEHYGAGYSKMEAEVYATQAEIGCGKTTEDMQEGKALIDYLLMLLKKQLKR